MEHSVKEFFFGPETALSHVGIWEKKLLVALGYSLIDEERKEGGKKNRSKWNLNTLLAERSTKERNMGVVVIKLQMLNLSIQKHHPIREAIL